MMHDMTIGLKNRFFFFKIYLFVHLFAGFWGMWDLTSLTRGQTHAVYNGSMES